MTTENKFKVGQQWKCRDGNMAVIVRAPCGGGALVWLDNHGQALWFDKDGKRGGVYDLIEPWVEKRTMEVELAWVEGYGSGLVCLAENAHSAYGKDIIARKKITITEGEGME